MAVNRVWKKSTHVHWFHPTDWQWRLMELISLGRWLDLVITYLVCEVILGGGLGLPKGLLSELIVVSGLVFTVTTVILAQLQRLWQRAPGTVRTALAKKALTHIDAAFDEMKNLQREFDGGKFSPLKIQRFIQILDSCHKHLNDVQYNPINRLLNLVLNFDPCMEDISGLKTDLCVLLEEPDKVSRFPKDYFYQKAAHIIEQISQIRATANYIGNV